MNWKKVAWRSLLLVLAVYAVVKLYGRVKHDMVVNHLHWSNFRSLSPAALPLLVSVLLIIAVNILHAFLWRRVSADLGSPVPNARGTMHVYFISGLSKYVVKLGQVAGLAVLAGKHGMAVGRATAAVLIGQLVFMITGCLFVSVMMPTAKQAAKLPLDPALLGIVLALATIVGTWVLVGTPVGKSIREGLIRRVSERTGERIHAAFAMVEEAEMRDVAVWAIGYTISWAVLALAFVLFAIAFIPGAAHSVSFIAGTVAATYLIGYISPFQAGLGRELPMAILLGYVMPGQIALIIAVLSRFWFMSGELLPIALIPLMGPRDLTLARGASQ